MPKKQPTSLVLSTRGCNADVSPCGVVVPCRLTTALKGSRKAPLTDFLLCVLVVVFPALCVASNACENQVTEHKALQGDAWLWVLDPLQTNILEQGKRGQTFHADLTQALCCAEHRLVGPCLWSCSAHLLPVHWQQFKLCAGVDCSIKWKKHLLGGQS